MLDAPSGAGRELLERVHVTRVAVELELETPTRLHFLHGGALLGLLTHAHGAHELPVGVVPLACESGQVRYEAGDRYRFGLTVAGAPHDTVDRLLDGIARVGRERSVATDTRLGGNFRVVGATRQELGTLAAALPELRSGDTLVLRARSPLRVPRPDRDRTSGHGYLDASYLRLAPLFARAFGRVHALATGVYPTQELRRAIVGADVDDLEGSAGHLVWLDMPVGAARRPNDRTRPGGYTLGGIVGRVAMGRLPDAWLPWLAAATVVHVGEGTHYGFGEVAIHASDDEPPPRWCRPARTLLDRSLGEAALDDALAHAGALLAEEDGAPPEALDVDVEHVVHHLRNGTFRPASLTGIVIPKARGGVRALAVPPLAERVVQRAVCQTLMPSVDALLDDCSFAYRKGFSVKGAVQAIERAWRDGFRWVLDADVRAFFDSVDLDLLGAKLHALFPDDPLVSALTAWLRAPVRFGGLTIERTRGLPQGMPVSPVLANLYLDELDERVLGEGFRLIRYADDFVVLCRDREAAERARDEVRHALDALGLALHEEKTRVTSFEAGFTFLGHVFCRSLALPVSDDAHDAELDARPSDPTAVPRESWLAQVPLEHLRALVRSDRQMGAPGTRRVVRVMDAAPIVPDAPASNTTSSPTPSGATPAVALRAARTRRAEVVPLERIDAHERELGRPLYVLGDGARIRLRLDTVEIERDGADAVACPLRGLSHVVIGPAARVSVDAALRLADVGKPVFFVRSNGRLRASLGGTPTWHVWEAQARAAADPAMRLVLSRAVVQAKLTHTASVVAELGPACLATATEIRALAARVDMETGVDAIRGVEGLGARLAFGALGTTLDPRWGFRGRARRPPPDAVNAMLSYGYTILHQCVGTALVAAGCNPRIGLFHGERAGHDALASDLQEEWRHVVDRVVVAQARLRVPNDGFVATADGGCLMSYALRAEFTNAVLAALCEETRRPDGSSRSVLERIGTQAIRYREWVCGRLPSYLPHEG